ncbi:unnamed protein product [Schistosoma curassoni]|uniref:Transcriptional regulator n=1 Tax=Schistosoma curassoni TaxID=6186 RepID=A0A183KH00_9TREM|nr:unnamed protein product [Schistosoma curassoni]
MSLLQQATHINEMVSEAIPPILIAMHDQLKNLFH